MGKSAYQKYKQLLTELKKLIITERGETKTAEKIRSQMDKLWFKIPENQRIKINKNVKLPSIST